MKFNFRKIASVMTSAVMLSSTVAFAAAANFPDPFVKNGVGDYALVTGSTALPTDNTAALDVNAFLAARVTTTSTPRTTAAPTGGEFLKFEKSTNKLNLGEAITSIYTTLDDDELPNVLKSGIYEDDDGTEYDFDQKITLGGLTPTHFADDEVDPDEKPVIGFNIDSGTNVLNYTLDFTDTPANSSALLETTTIEMLGREYYISDVGVAAGGGLKLTLLDTANSATVYENEPVTVTVGDTSYEVSIISVTTSGNTERATLMVNGNKIDSINVGNSRKIATDTYLSVLDVFQASREADKHWVEFSIGTGKIVLENGRDLEINDEVVDEIAVNMSIPGGELSQIKLVWTTEDDEFIVPGRELVLPGFESIKFSMTGFVRTDLEDLSVTYNGKNFMEVKSLDVKDGSITLPILYTNASKTGFAGIGKDATHVLRTAAGTNPSIALAEDVNTRFAATWISSGGDDWESYVFELVSINKISAGAKNETKIKNLANGNVITFTDSDDKDVGEITLTVSNTDGDAETATINITSSSGSAYADRIVTAKGLQFRLPVIANNSNDGSINLIATPGGVASWIMNFTEADEDNNVGTGASFTLTLGHTTSNGPHVSSVSPATWAVEDGSDNYEAYIGGSNSHGTKLLYKTGGDQDSVDIEYPGEEAFLEVYISESGVTAGGGDGGTAGGLVVRDNEVSSVSGKNLIVIGGSCVNTVAARLLGSNTPLCGTDWESSTGVGAGAFLIQTFASPYSTNKIATLVAGYDAIDTTNAANALKTETIDTTTGKKFVKRAGQNLQLV